MGSAKDQGGLGFWDLICFNKALLAKQCWRLLQFPNSLAANIIKAKYYPRGATSQQIWGASPRLPGGVSWQAGTYSREGLFGSLAMGTQFGSEEINGSLCRLRTQLRLAAQTSGRMQWWLT
jgi:hypothetical protein